MTAAALLAFLASLVATAVGFYNAGVRRFAEQRWWLKKEEAYGNLVATLSTVVYYHEQHYDAAIGAAETPEQHRQELSEAWRAANTELKRYTASGAFMISPGAEAALRKMWRDQDAGRSGKSWFEHVESSYEAARTCLEEIVTEAKRDLREGHSMSGRTLAREWLLLVGSLLFGLGVLPWLLRIASMPINIAVFYGALVGGREVLSAWLLVVSPYAVVQLLRSIAWAIRASRET